MSILDPLTLDFLVRLGPNFHHDGWIWEVDWASDIFLVTDGQKRD